MADATAALDCIAQVLAEPGWRRTDADNRALAGQLFRLRAQVDAALSAVTSSAVEQGQCTGFRDSTTGTMAWLRAQTEQPLMSMELRAAVERGEAAGALPELSALHREGAVTTGFLDAAVRGLRLLPADCAAVLDHALAEAAQTLPASFVPRLVRLVRSSLGLEPDGGKFMHPNDGAPEVWLSRYGSDDRYLLRGDLDTLAGAQLDAMLTRLSRPRDDQDRRTVPQRVGAALAQIVRLAAMAEGDDLTPGMVPPHGMDAHVVVRTTVETLTEQVGAPDAVTDDGAVIDRGQLAALLCHQPISTAVTARAAAMSGSSDAAPGDWSALRASYAGLLPFPLGDRVEPLYLGRAARIASRAQWLALLLRDQTCQHPQCSRGPRWCQAHHLLEWDADSGPTDLDNLVLLCWEHHAQLHRARAHLVPAGDGTYRVVDAEEWRELQAAA